MLHCYKSQSWEPIENLVAAAYYSFKVDTADYRLGVAAKFKKKEVAKIFVAELKK